MFNINRFFKFLMAKKQIKFAKIYPKQADIPVVSISTF